MWRVDVLLHMKAARALYMTGVRIKSFSGGTESSVK